MYTLNYGVNLIWNAILMNSMKWWNGLSFFPGYWLFGVDQGWDDYPGGWGVETGRLGRVMLPFFSRPVVTAGCLEHRKHITPPLACRLSTFICRDSSHPFSLIGDWIVLLLDTADWLLAETDDAVEILTVECCSSFTRESKEPSVTAAGVCTFWLAISKKILLSLLKKYCLMLGWLALHFCRDIIFWYYPHKKVNVWNLEKSWLTKNVWHCRKDLICKKR